MTSFNHVRGDTFSVLHTLRQANQQGRNLTGYQIAATLEQRNGVVVSTLDVQLLDQSTLAGQFVLSVADSSTWPLTRLRYKVRFVDPMGNISTSGHIDVRVTTAHESGCCLAEDAVQVGVSPEIVIIEDTPDQLTVSVGTVLVGGGGGINLPIEQSDVRELPTVLNSLEQADAAESQARQIAVGNLQQQIAGVTALAQTNQLNLGTKADQTDLNATNAQVELNRLAILSKADITALAMLAALVNTKADQSYVHDQIAALVGSDAQLLATIQAIADELANTEGLIEALDYTVANRVRFDIANQALTTLQKYNARTNIGAEELGTAQLLIAQITAATIGAATAAQGAKADTALQSADMAPVAFTGQFSSLAGQSGIFNVVFSAYTAGINSILTAADTLGTMLGKLQAQILSKQDASTALTQLASLTHAEANVIQYKGGALASRTPAQIKTDMGLDGLSSVGLLRGGVLITEQSLYVADAAATNFPTSVVRVHNDITVPAAYNVAGAVTIVELDVIGQPFGTQDGYWQVYINNNAVLIGSQTGFGSQYPSSHRLFLILTRTASDYKGSLYNGSGGAAIAGVTVSGANLPALNTQFTLNVRWRCNSYNPLVYFYTTYVVARGYKP